VREFVFDVLSSKAALGRELINNRKVLSGLSGGQVRAQNLGTALFGVWQQEFHDQEHIYKESLNREEVIR